MKYIAFVLMLIGNIPNKFMECHIYSMHNWCFKLKKSLLKGIWKNLMHSWKKRIFKVSCKIFHCFKNKKTSLSCDPRGRHISRPWATELCGWRLAFLSNRIDSSLIPRLGVSCLILNVTLKGSAFLKIFYIKLKIYCVSSLKNWCSTKCFLGPVNALSGTFPFNWAWMCRKLMHSSFH